MKDTKNMPDNYKIHSLFAKPVYQVDNLLNDKLTYYETIIIKSIYCANNDASSAILVNMNFVDSSDSSTEYEFFRDEVAAKTQVNASPSGLNLEAGDAITVQAATGSSKIQGLISYALIDRRNENG